MLENLTATLDANTIQNLTLENHALRAIITALIMFFMLGYGFFFGFIAGRPTKIQKEIIGRALRASPKPTDPIILKRYNKLLDFFREKPQE